MRLRLLENNGMSFLEDLVDGDEGFKGLDFVGKYRLPMGKGVSFPSVKVDSGWTYTFMPDQKEFEFL
jgi:hypothetical protein